MYPLDTVIVTNDERILPALRQELARNDAPILAEYPDVSAALAQLETAEGQRLLFVTYLRGSDDLRQLQRLVQAYPAHPVAALVDDESDMALDAMTDAGISSMTRATMFVRAMRAGAMQVITLPLDANDFQSALDSLASRFAPAADSKLIVVTGVQGGCGATTVAINLADAVVQTTNRNCILAELTPRLGMLASSFDVKPDYTLNDVLVGRRADPQLLKSALATVEPKLSVLCGPYRDLAMVAGSSAEDETTALEDLLDHLRRLAPTVVAELPATLDERYFQLLQKADTAIFVVEQSLPAIHSLQLILKSLLPAEHQEQVVVVNRYDCHVKGVTLERLREVLRNAQVWKIETDPLMKKAANEGRLLRDVAPKATPLAEFRELARSMTKSDKPDKPASGFWNWLAGSDSHARKEVQS